MSAFLFYKPNSNPGRFSRKERFSQRLPVSSTLDGLSNGKADTSGNIPAASVSSSPMRLDNDFDAELSKWPLSAHTTNTLAEDMRDGRHGSTTPQDDDRDSLHSLFSESSTGCGSGAMGLTDQDARHQEAIPEFSRPNDTPSCFNPGEIFATDQCAFPIVLDGHDTPCQPRSNQQELNEREPHSMTVQPVRRTSQSAPSPTCYSAISSDSAPSSPGASPRSCTFTSHVQTMAIDANFQEHSTSYGEADPLNDVDMQSVSSHNGEIQIDTNNLKADHHHHEGRIVGSPDNIVYSQNPAGCPEKVANLEIGIEHLRSEAQSLPSRRDLVSTRSRSYDSLHPTEFTALAERRPHMDSCHPDPRFTTTQETDNGSQPSALPIDEAQSEPVPATNLASTPSQPDVDMEIENASQNCSNATNFPRGGSEATPSHGYNSENSEASSGRCVTHEADSDVSTPSTSRNTPTARSERTSLSLSPSPIQPRQMTFSHVEIRNVQHTKPRDKSVEVSNKNTSDQIHCTSRAKGPWQLDGTTLSVDIRDVERIPVLVGYSTYRVVGGQLIQSITLAQGNTWTPFPGKPTREEKKRRSHGINTGKTSSRGPLSLEQKRDLVRLREDGYSWNEITSMFPGRKKGSLQGIYYTKLRGTHNRTSQTNQRRRRRSSDPPYTMHPHRTTGVSINSRAQPEKATKHPRYSFRARHVA